MSTLVHQFVLLGYVITLVIFLFAWKVVKDWGFYCNLIKHYVKRMLKKEKRESVNIKTFFALNINNC